MNLNNLTLLQWLGVVLVVNGAITGSVSEVTDLLGATWANHAISLASIGSSICGGLVTMFGGQGTQIRNVAAMPGVDSININAKANQTAAQIAVSNAPEDVKVKALPQDKAAVAATAQAAA